MYTYEKYLETKTKTKQKMRILTFNIKKGILNHMVYVANTISDMK